MKSSLRKNLTRIVLAMCLLMVLSFASVLLNGTVFFLPKLPEEQSTETRFKDLVIGEPQLQRINKQVAWVISFSATQKENLVLLDAGALVVGTACDTLETYCILLAETERLGIYLQYSEVPPSQVPAETPWYGGFVNPITGNVYDLLGRPYAFQDQVDPLIVLK